MCLLLVKDFKRVANFVFTGIKLQRIFKCYPHSWVRPYNKNRKISYFYCVQKCKSDVLDNYEEKSFYNRILTNLTDKRKTPNISQ